MTTDNHDQALEARARAIIANQYRIEGSELLAQDAEAGGIEPSPFYLACVVAALREARVPEVSQTTQALIDMLVQRDQLGRAKYGVTLDREDLTHEQWLQHMAEEMLDGAGYALAAIRAAAKDGRP